MQLTKLATQLAMTCVLEMAGFSTLLEAAGEMPLLQELTKLAQSEPCVVTHVLSG
jgi:hypothetical protein